MTRKEAILVLALSSFEDADTEQAAKFLCQEIVRLNSLNRNLEDLLAIIHGDSGHHTEWVGEEQSVKDAHRVWADLKGEIGRLEAENKRLKAGVIDISNVNEKGGYPT